MLSDAYLWTQSEKTMIGGSIHIIRFARAIEAEVRKQEEDLIQQLVGALDTAFHQTCSVGRPKDWEQIRNALHSARARLEGKS